MKIFCFSFFEKIFVVEMGSTGSGVCVWGGGGSNNFRGHRRICLAPHLLGGGGHSYIHWWWWGHSLLMYYLVPYTHLGGLSALNTLWPSDAMWRQRSWTTLAQVMACCLMAPSHYLNQCWLMISEMLWHSPDSNISQKIHKIFIVEMSLKFTNLRL